jgi:hypothetical protein
MVTRRVSALVVLDDSGQPRGTVAMETLAHFADTEAKTP